MSYDPLPAALAISRIIRASGKTVRQYLLDFPEVASLEPEPEEFDIGKLEAYHAAFMKEHNFADIAAMVGYASDLTVRKPLGPRSGRILSYQYTKAHPRSEVEREYLRQSGRELGAAAAGRNLPNTEIKARTGLSNGYISAIFQGDKNANCSEETLQHIAEKGLGCDLEAALAEGRRVPRRLESTQPLQEIMESYRTNNGLKRREIDLIKPLAAFYFRRKDYPQRLAERIAILDTLGYETVAELGEATRKFTPEHRDPRLVKLLEEAAKKKSLVDAEDARRGQKPDGEKSP